MTECNQCGDCCESFPLNTPQRADVYGGARLADPRVAGENRKAAAWMASLTVLHGPDERGRWFYSCPRFDPVARRCTAYADRPHTCRDYPWYRKPPSTFRNVPARCAFKADTADYHSLPIVAVT